MDYNHLSTEEQMKRIIEETNEILQNFHEISELLVNRINRSDTAMLNLGRKIACDREDEQKSNRSAR
ncbi:MAG: hypothetical protein GX568_09245 [Candidatus Gastranaerophilales bacterium]|jgi:Asp-tRNA(Asn)/Glu-tRNA(Gln) amidotransferase C subunit|nr:hypothetical protein [Candidatus Gastranaerophilales bacterium]